MNNAKLFLKSLVTVALPASLIACGGGGSGSSPPATYLFYQTAQMSPNAASIGISIGAVDPANPANPMPIETPAVTNAETIYHGTYNAAIRSLSDVHPRTVIYVKDGKLWKVSALKQNSPSPAQISSERAANEICGNASTDSDFSNHNNAVYRYSLPGPDGSCYTADDIRKMVKVGMSAADAPTNLGNIRPITSIMDPQTGALKGWLAADNGNLNSYDANFTNPSSIKKTSTQDVNYVASAGITRIFLRIYGDLYLYNADTGSLSASLHTFSSPFTSITSRHDGESFFFVDESNLYKMSVNGSAPATLFNSESSTGIYTSLYLTRSKLVYTWYDTISGKYFIKSLPKTGGATQTLRDNANQLNVINVSKEGWIHYNKGYSISDPVAAVIRDDGTGGNEISNSMWVGATYSRSGNLETGEGLGFKRLILAEGFKRATGFASSTLKSYDASANTLVTTIGTIPSGIYAMSFFGYEAGGNLLGFGQPDAGNPWEVGTDIFFINTEAQNSLNRVTDTPALIELPRV